MLENIVAIMNAPIDWSWSGGPIWLALFLGTVAVLSVGALVLERRGASS